MVEPEAARGKNPGSIQRPIRNTGVGSRTHVAWTPESFCYGKKESGCDSLPYSDGRSGHLEPRSEMQGMGERRKDRERDVYPRGGGGSTGDTFGEANRPP